MSHTAEHNAKIGEGVRRTASRKRKLESLLPAHVTAWKRRGEVAPALRPVLEARLHHLAGIVEDLGGPSEITNLERAVLDGWLVATVTADALWSRYLREGDEAALDRVPTLLNSARAALQAVGLKRRARELDVLDVRDYERALDEQEDSAAQLKGDS